MKKYLIAIIALLSVALTSCEGPVVKKVNDVDNGESTSMFINVEEGPRWKILCHKETKVLYAVSDYGDSGRGVFTVLVDRDGKPLTWKGGVQ